MIQYKNSFKYQCNYIAIDVTLETIEKRLRKRQEYTGESEKSIQKRLTTAKGEKETLKRLTFYENRVDNGGTREQGLKNFEAVL